MTCLTINKFEIYFFLNIALSEILHTDLWRILVGHMIKDIWLYEYKVSILQL